MVKKKSSLSSLDPHYVSLIESALNAAHSDSTEEDLEDDQSNWRGEIHSARRSVLKTEMWFEEDKFECCNNIATCFKMYFMFFFVESISEYVKKSQGRVSAQ